MNKNTIIAVVLVILAAAGGFYGGMQYKASQRSQFSGMGGQFRQRFGGQNGGVVRGQVVSIDNDTLTVKLADGSSKIVILASGTLFVKSASAAKTDIKAGDTVMAFGTANSDGTVTAQNVSLNPPMGMGRGGGQQSGSQQSGQQQPATGSTGSGY